MKLSIIMLVYNEINTIGEIIKRVQKVEINKEIIIIDDCSTDGTKEYLERLEKNDTVKVFFHLKNMGKGSCIKTGIKNVSGDIVVIQDADLEYNPEEYHLLIKPILDGRADIVYSSRFISSGERRVLLFWHFIGNKLLTFLTNMITNLNLSNMETCYKMFKTEILKKVNIEQNRFGFEPEITIKAARMGCRFYEVGISYSGRDYTEGKKINWKDGIFAIWCIIKYGFIKKSPF